MEIKHIRLLLEAVECGSILGTANRLHMPHSTLSRSLKQLEMSVGVPLIDRHGRGIALTEAGRLFCNEIAPLVRRFDKAHEDLSAPTVNFAGSISIGLVTVVSNAIAISVVMRVRERWPQIDLRIHNALSGRLAELLSHGKVDVAVVSGSHMPQAFRQRSLISYSLFHMVHRQTVRASEWRDTTIPFQNLNGSNMIVSSIQQGVRRQIDQAAADAKIKWNVVAEVDSLDLMKTMAREGLGGIIMPYASIGKDAADPEMLVRRVVEPTISDDIVVATAPDRSQNQVLRTVSQIIIPEEFRRAVADGRFLHAS